jgi:hypothetical protein
MELLPPEEGVVVVPQVLEPPALEPPDGALAVEPPALEPPDGALAVEPPALEPPDSEGLALLPPALSVVVTEAVAGLPPIFGLDDSGVDDPPPLASPVFPPDDESFSAEFVCSAPPR